MDGIFLRKKFNIWLFLLFLCGLFFIGQYIFLNMIDPAATSGLISFLLIGITICLVVIPSWLLNAGAFIHIDENSILAKYHWFGKMNCKMTDVAFAVARGNSLIIQLKNGKTHTIMGIQNTWPLCAFIRRNMIFEVPEQPQTLIAELDGLKTAKKKGILYVCTGIAFMFIHIFITVLLTGERDLHEFNQMDWTIFSIMGIIEIATVIATFYFAQKAGKYTLPIEKLQYEIRRRIIETKPVIPGKIIKILTDDNYNGRITVYEHSNGESVYYTSQAFTSDYSFIITYESENYENMKQLPGDVEALIDITEKFMLVIKEDD